MKVSVMPNEKFGKQVRYDRESASMTVRDLAKEASIDYSYVSKIENGKATSRLSKDVVKALALALNADELEYFRLSGLLPESLSNCLQDPNARQFLRRISESDVSKNDWEALQRLLSRRLELSQGLKKKPTSAA
ncbi:MAG: helix-turn-helix transcriptional regulator [Planctomycetota bacterium]